MFESLTATGTVAAAGEWVGLIDGVVLLVVGLGLAFAVASWVIGKMVHR